MSGFNMYIDESYDNKSNFIALAGVIVAHNEWNSLNGKINDLKMKYFGDKNFNFKNIRRNKYDDREGKWAKLTEEQKKNFYDEFFSILRDRVTLIVSLIDREKMNNKDIIKQVTVRTTWVSFVPGDLKIREFPEMEVVVK